LAVYPVVGFAVASAFHHSNISEWAQRCPETWLANTCRCGGFDAIHLMEHFQSNLYDGNLSRPDLPDQI
jgi:hypothetical protein